VKWRESWAKVEREKARNRDDNTKSLRSIGGILSILQRIETRLVNYLETTHGRLRGSAVK
jgi:hypothetical protein